MAVSGDAAKAGYPGSVAVRPALRNLVLPRLRINLLSVLILAYVTIAILSAPLIWVAMVRSYLGQAVDFLPVVLFGALIVSAVQQPTKPFDRLRDLARTGGLRLIGVMTALCLGLASFTTMKIGIPGIVPFYLDPALADLDLWLHGVNPGEAALRLLPDVAVLGLGHLYGGVWFAQWFGWIAFVTLQGDAALRGRYFWTMALMFALLGTVLATALSSVGPAFYAEFYGDTRFAPLTALLDATVWGDDLTHLRAYLLDTYITGKPNMGTGISAMPSMHLAVVTLNALMLWRVNRLAGVAGWVYVGLILIGSVTFGWHYATDGYVSIAVVCLIWLAVGRALRAPPV